MRRIITICVTAVAAGGLIACGEPPVVSVEAKPVSAELRDQGPTLAIESGERLIRVSRVYRAPDQCRNLSGDVARVGGDLTLRVLAHPVGVVDCPRDEQLLFYTATIQGLRPGRYNLRVLHQAPDQRPASRLVLEHPVVVMKGGRLAQ